MVPFVLVGMAIWALLALVLLPFRDQLAAQRARELDLDLRGRHPRRRCPASALMIVHDRNRRRRRAHS